MLIKATFSKLEIKADGQAGSFTGYGSVFGNRDSDGDVIVPGAFAKSLATHKANGSMPRLLWQHRSDNPIGEWETLREDDHGLWAQGQLWVDGDHPDRDALKAHRLMKGQGGAGLSIGFWIDKEEIDRETGTRRILDVRLAEISVVSFPANSLALTTGVKAAAGITNIRDFEAWLRDAGGFSREAAKSIAARGWKKADPRDAAADGDDDPREAAEALERLAQALRGIRAA